MTAMFRSLSERDFRIWFVGAFVSNIGGWMQTTAQNWVVLTELTDSNALAVGVTVALQFAPPLLLSPVTGLIADRFDRRKILFITQTAMLALDLALGIVLIAGHAQLWHLYVFALLLGVVSAVDVPCRQTFITDLVAHAHMSNAVALNSAQFNAARMIGPAIAGLLILIVGSGWVFILNAFSFIAMLIALGMLRNLTPQFPRTTSPGNQFVAGFRYILGRPDLIVVFIIVFLVGAFGMNFPIFSSTMAVAFGRGAGEFGLLSSIIAIGSLAGALLSARRERARIRVIIVASASFGLAALISALTPTFWAFATSTVLIGFAAVTLMTTANGYVQSTTAPGMRGRVVALYMAILMGGTPIGAPIVGAVADHFGPRWGLGVAAVSGAVAALIGLGWLIVARGMRIEKHPRTNWRPVLKFADAPTAAIAIIPSPDLRTVVPPEPVTPVGCSEGRSGVCACTAASVAPVDFSEEVALTSPIPLPHLRARNSHGNKQTPDSSLPPAQHGGGPLGQPDDRRCAEIRQQINENHHRDAIRRNHEQ
ncbi:MAG: hypothetical protein B5766_00245 [Candidatus Lumbricidophila eiseniae]|uniref:Major facilitator superfamily (MFS) profile domain-containing protein n=1 Tax=Candidatus Lumbricidiphila eiseniae TaxID=1969409 RepID=A0A2A6FV87_9MICO|nr:MAG: hypothetical protein B5766_00245 [Candidatus Lumbricidophila eiseniae]